MPRTLVLGALAVFACGPAAAASVTGLWSLSENNARIQISRCGQALCGRLVSADKLRANPDHRDKENQDPALRKRRLKGVVVLSGFRGGPEKWTGGRVYNPDDGQTYKSELTLADARTLKVTGCVVKPLCKSQTLTRVR